MPTGQQEGGRRRRRAKAGKRELLGVPLGYAGALAVLVVSAGAIAGILLAATGDRVSPTVPEQGDTRFSAPEQAALAPDLTVQTARGSTFTLSGHRGQPVTLFFMAPG